MDEAAIADKVVNGVAKKPRKAIIEEGEASDGIVKMINGDDANIIQSLMQCLLVVDDLKEYFL